MIWQRLMYAVNNGQPGPEPLCRTKGDKVLEWTDSRPQPTQAQLDAVTQAQLDTYFKTSPELTAEELYDMLETKGTLRAADRPRPKRI